MTASSITSSWYSEAWCTSSTDTAPAESRLRSRRVRIRSPTAMASAGLRRLAAGLDEMGRDLVEEAVTRRDRVEQGGFQAGETVLDRGNTEKS